MTCYFKDKICENCGRVFTPSGSSSTWCNECCLFTCQNCGRQFKTSRFRIEQGTVNFCSKNCQIEGRTENNYEHTCPGCGNNFISKSRNSRFCLDCRTVECPICKNKRVVQSKYVGKAVYCSRECKNRGKRTHDWSEEDEAFVRDVYPYKMPVSEIAEYFGVSSNAVNRFVRKLNLPHIPLELRGKRASERTRIWTKERIIEKIKSIAQSEPLNSSNFQENNGSLHNLACDRFGSWQKAVEAAGFDYDEINLYAFRKTWTTEDIVETIQSFYGKGEDLKASYVRDNHGDLFNAARRDPNLGTWEAAVEKAGISYFEVIGERWGSKYLGFDDRTYDSETEGKIGDLLYRMKNNSQIVDYHTQVKVEEGRAWRCDFVIDLVDEGELWLEVDGLGEARKDGMYGDNNEKINFYNKHGFEFSIIHTPKQANEVILDPRKRKQKRTPKYDGPRNFVELGSCRYSDDELLAELERVCNKLGRNPTQKEMDEIGNITAQTIKRRLGWAEACASVGFPICKKRDLIVEDVSKVSASLGRAPSLSEYLRLGRYCGATIKNHIGDFDEAIVIAGYEPLPKTISWTPDKVIEEMHKLDGILPDLSWPTLKSSGNTPLYHAGRRYFGSWANALTAAGLSIPDTRNISSWAKEYNECTSCGQTRLRHAGKGLCSSCYSRYRRQG
jgi:hypothetical protein